MKNQIEKTESRKVKSIVEEAVLKTIITVTGTDDMAALKLEHIMENLGKGNLGKYFTREVHQVEKNIKKLEGTQKERADRRLAKIKRESLGLINLTEFKIFDTICGQLKLDARLIRSEYRQTDYADARKMLAFILSWYLDYGPSRSSLIMHKHHSTLIHAVRKHIDYMESDSNYKRKFFSIMEKLRVNVPELFKPVASEQDAYLETILKYKYKVEKERKIKSKTIYKK